MFKKGHLDLPKVIQQKGTEFLRVLMTTAEVSENPIFHFQTNCLYSKRATRAAYS